MSQFKIIQTILLLIKGNVNGVLDEAKTLETQLAGVGVKLENKKTELDQWVEKTITQLAAMVNVAGLQTKMEASQAYQQLSAVPIDFGQLFSLPEGFKADNPEMLKTLVENKIQFLKNYLSNLHIDGVDPLGILNDLEDIVLSLIDLPKDLDLTDAEAVLAFKKARLEGIKPKVFSLIEKMFHTSLTGGELDKAITAFDNAVDSILEPSSAINGTGGMTDLSSFLAKAKPKVPDIAHELDVFNTTLGGDMDTYGTEAIDYLQSILPKVEKEFANVDVETLNLEAVVNILKRLFPILNDFSNQPNLAKLTSELAQVLPKVTLTGITEQAFIQGLEQIFTLPKGADLETPSEVFSLLKKKIPALFELLKHVQISDKELSSLKEKLLEVFGDILAPFKDLDQLKLGNIISGLLEVITTLISKYIPDNKVLTDVADVSGKFKVIWDFLEENGLLIPIKFKILKSNPITGTGINQPGTQQTPAAQANRAVKPQAAFAGQNGNAAGTSEPSNGRANNQDTNWGTVILAALKSHSAELPTMEQQVLAQGIFSGEIVQVWQKELMAILNGTIAEGKQAGASIKSMAASATPPTSEQVATLLLNQLKSLVETAFKDLKTLLSASLEIIYRLMQLAIDLLLAIKIPKEKIVEMIPGISVLEDINIICLFMAMPKWMVQKLLDIKKEEIVEWVRNPV